MGTFERYRQCFPGKLVNDDANMAPQWGNRAAWETAPELAEQIMPLLIRQTLRNQVGTGEPMNKQHCPPSLKKLLKRPAQLVGHILAHPDADSRAMGFFE